MDNKNSELQTEERSSPPSRNLTMTRIESKGASLKIQPVVRKQFDIVKNSLKYKDASNVAFGDQDPNLQEKNAQYLKLQNERQNKNFQMPPKTSENLQQFSTEYDTSHDDYYRQE